MQNLPDFVINPNTGRYVKVGSKVYQQLENNMLLHGKYKKQPNTIYEGVNHEEAKIQKNKIKNDDNKSNFKVSKNKIIKINRKIPKNEYRDKIMDAGTKVLKRSLTCDNIAKMSDEQMTAYFKQQLYSEILNLPKQTDTVPKKSTKTFRVEHEHDDGEEYEDGDDVVEY